MTIEQLNGLPPEQAEVEFRACCGSSRWSAAMAASRPFENLDTLLAAADRIWWTTGPEDWDEAMAAHPRIGQTATQAQVIDAKGWTANEQEAVAGSDQAARRELAAAVDEYERKFGWIYLVCASGRSAQELLQDLRARLDHEPGRERRVAAGEELRITQMRLRKLIETGVQ